MRSQVVRADKGNSNFDIELIKGTEGEDLWIYVLERPPHFMEIKTENDAITNFFIETEQDKYNVGKFEPSGLSITTAEWIVFIKYDAFVGVMVEKLKELEKVYPKKEVRKSGDVPTNGFSVPFHNLVANAPGSRARYEAMLRDLRERNVRRPYS